MNNNVLKNFEKIEKFEKKPRTRAQSHELELQKEMEADTNNPPLKKKKVNKFINMDSNRNGGGIFYI